MSRQDGEVPLQEGHFHARRREKPSRQCYYCDQTFSKTEHLERHVRSHTKERPFGCKVCDKTYSRYDSLLRHHRTHSRQRSRRTAASAATAKAGLLPASAVEDTTLREVVVVRDEQPQRNKDGAGAIDDRSISVSASVSSSDARVDEVSAVANPVQTPEYEVTQEGVVDGEAGLEIPAHISPGSQQATGGFPGLPSSIINTPTDLDFLDLNLNVHDSAWLLGSNFDIAAVNDTITNAISEWGTGNTGAGFLADRMHDGWNGMEQLKNASDHSQPVLSVQQNWHTRISRGGPPSVNADSLSSPDKGRVDEAYRMDLSHRLRPQVQDHALPSADFLNLCIKLYFAKFNPAFPLIHPHSFRPCSENALLLLSICSIGALFIGSSRAEAQGRKIFQTLNKAILASWENYIGRDSPEVLSLVQAATIGQTFGMLSGHPSDLILTESFHGTVIAWARQGGFFKARNPSDMTQVDGSPSLECAWKAWARAEEASRLVIGLHIHDTEFATTFHHEPLLRHTTTHERGCCSEVLFSATTATQWREQLDALPQRNGASYAFQDPYPPRPLLPPSESHITAYAALSGILASIQEKRCGVLDASSSQHSRGSLLAWHNDFSGLLENHGHEPTSLHVLWHEAFLVLYADFDLLERAIGREGPPASKRASEGMKQWSLSSEARRSVLHALLILKQAEKFPSGAGVAIHVPKALFYSGIVIYSYIKSTTSLNISTPLSDDDLDMPEFRISEQTGALDGSSDTPSSAAFSPIDTSILCYIIDLLRRVGHWGISRHYAMILENLLDDFACKD